MGAARHNFFFVWLLFVSPCFFAVSLFLTLTLTLTFSFQCAQEDFFRLIINSIAPRTGFIFAKWLYILTSNVHDFNVLITMYSIYSIFLAQPHQVSSCILFLYVTCTLSLNFNWLAVCKSYKSFKRRKTKIQSQNIASVGARGQNGYLFLFERSNQLSCKDSFNCIQD